MMYLDFWREEKARKKVVGALALLVMLTVAYVSFLNIMVADLLETVEQARRHEEKQIENFLDLRLYMQEWDLENIEKSWASFQQTPYYDADDYQSSMAFFKKYYLDDFTQYIWLNMVLAYDDAQNIIYLDYGNPAYETVQDEFLQMPFEKKEGPQVLNGDPGMPFGQGQRYFVNATTLYYEELPVLVMVAFYEPFIFESFINTADSALFDRITHQASKLTYSVVLFMLSIMVFGVFVIFVIRSFVYETVISYVKQQTFGHIAVKRGFMTIDQVNAIIKEQESAILNNSK